MTIVISPLLRRLCLATVVIMVFLLFYLGAQPIAVNLFPEPWDRLAHFVAFGAMAGLLGLGASPRQPLRVILAVSLVGVLDEWRQLYLPGRSADIADLLTDVVAAIAVVTLLEWLRLRGVLEDAPETVEP